jgi:3-hydroxyacyl-CoA dehydrogenase
MRQELRNVAIVGTGLVGCGWAVAFALGGASVRLYDENAATLKAAPARIRALLDDMEAAGLADRVDEAAGRISVSDTLAATLEGVDYVQESVFERVEVKAAVAGEIGELISADTVVGSSSSGLPASSFTEHAPKRERFIIAHPVNPPHLVPLVELVPAPWTDPEVMPWLRARLTEIGKVPVEVKREIDGFILNRLQGALLNEAWTLYEEGYATTADIDATISQGLGLRWAFMGPFETIDLNAPGGVADYAERLSPLYYRVAEARKSPRRWSPDLVRRVTDERRAALRLEDLAARCRWRDRKLIQLVAHLRKQQELP